MSNPYFQQNTLEHGFANFLSAEHWLAGRLVAVYPVIGKPPPTLFTDPLESRTQCRYTEQEQSVMLGMTTTVANF